MDQNNPLHPDNLPKCPVCNSNWHRIINGKAVLQHRTPCTDEEYIAAQKALEESSNAN